MDYTSNLFSVKDKVAILTGGGGVLASEMALGFLNAGAKVALLDINKDNLEKRIREFNKTENEVIGLECNVLDENNLKQVNAEILDRFGHIDVLVNAAGGNLPGATIAPNQSFFDLEIEQFKKVTDLNLIGTVLPTLVFCKTMADQKSGSIINVSSMAVARAITRVVGYSAAKAAINNFTIWMAVEMAQKFGDEIRVNAIAPGFLITGQNKALLTNEDGSLTERGQTIIESTPFKRFGKPDELVGAIFWLSSYASKFVNGAVIPIDGGFSAFSGV